MSESSSSSSSFSDSNARAELDLSSLLDSIINIENNISNNISHSNFSNENNSVLSHTNVFSINIDSNNSTILKNMSPPVFDVKNLNIIPSFDGNPCELFNFLKVSQTFLTLYWNNANENCVQNILLFEGIKSRIVGRAREVISVYGADTWMKIKQVLTQNFGDQRDENSLNRDLVNLKQNNESPQQFYEKIMSLLNIICNYIEIHNEDETIKTSKKDFFTQQALITFLAGLKEPLGSTIRAMRPTNLAIAMQYILEENNIRYLQRNNNPITQTPKNISNQFKSSTQNHSFNHPNSFRNNQPDFRNKPNNSSNFPTGPVNIQPRTNLPPQKFYTNSQVFGKNSNVWKPGQNQQNRITTPMSTSTKNTMRRPFETTRNFQPQPGPSNRPNYIVEELFNVDYENYEENQDGTPEFDEYEEPQDLESYEETNFPPVSQPIPET